jgi:hypothetical protein
MAEPGAREEVERRLGRPFERVQGQLEELFGTEWDEIEVVIETSAAKTGRSRVEVIADLLARAEARPAAPTRVRRALIRWIGKPWRERTNPRDRFKDRLPGPPPAITGSRRDLEEWAPLVPEDETPP